MSNSKSGSLRNDLAKAFSALSWYLEQPEFKEVSKQEGSIGFAIQALRTSLGERGALPLAPDRFEIDVLKAVVRDEVIKEFREKILPLAETQIRSVIQAAISEQPPVPIDVTAEQKKILAEREQLEQDQTQLKLDQEALEDKQKILDVEIKSFNELSQWCAEEADTYQGLCTEIQNIVVPIGGIRRLAGVVESVLQVTLDSPAKNVLSKSAKFADSSAMEFSDGMIWQELSALILHLKKQRLREPADFIDKVKVKKSARKKLASGITSEIGLTWQEICEIANNSKHLDHIKRDVLLKRKSAGKT